MTHKILYAVNSKPIEDVVTRSLDAQTNGGYVKVGAAAYREKVLPDLKQSGADILLYREDLKGSTDIFELLRQVRENFPNVRIIFMGNRHETTSRLICSLVFLGIYDILCGDTIPAAELVDIILHPHNFGDVAKYFHASYMNDYLPEAPQQAAGSPDGGKKGLLGGLMKGLGGLSLKPGGGQEQVQEAPQPATPAAPTVKVVQAPTVDMDAMRDAMLEDARRQAQQELGQLVADGVALQTLNMKEELEKQKDTITQLAADLREKTASEADLKNKLSEAIKLRNAAEDQLIKFQENAEFTTQQYQAQLVQLQTTKSADWYHEQTEKWLAERAHYKSVIDEQTQKINALTSSLADMTRAKDELSREVAERDQKLENMTLAVPRDVTSAIDETLEGDYVIVPDEDPEYRQMAPGGGRVIAFMGTKHGAGCSTIALNTAVALANAGFKTCYLEINRQFPMVAGFFEFNNIALGLDTALAALQQGNSTMAARCIIKPHAVKTNNKNMMKVYNRLPGPLHFLLYSNDFINRCRMGSAPYLSEEDMKNLIYFLTTKERYSYVILDIQPDDQNALNMVLASRFRAHQLVMVMTQDTHGIKTAGTMITALARSPGADLVRNTEFVINQFSPRNKMSVGNICDILHIPAKRVSKISLDSEGYMAANYAAVPYVLSNGKNRQEYMDLRMHLGR
ncbi:AAA family ATPase [Pseudoflavonifractor phocaeensis]|uniref:AAA family ATPase n=1 Tax=Pseudoflavonifractor phocaeensis TaxID=1870988 RepID=UPI00195608DE|nr:AAA family ATPase [Pseudoflavonifractor phocaeensis]MBM6722569.1 AAA family ATPase [Pseudoflavonifractor phocaeensis]